MEIISMLKVNFCSKVAKNFTRIWQRMEEIIDFMRYFFPNPVKTSPNGMQNLGQKYFKTLLLLKDHHKDFLKKVKKKKKIKIWFLCPIELQKPTGKWFIVFNSQIYLLETCPKTSNYFRYKLYTRYKLFDISSWD